MVAVQFFGHIQVDCIMRCFDICKAFLENGNLTFSLGYAIIQAYVEGPIQYLPGFILEELAVEKFKERLRLF